MLHNKTEQMNFLKKNQYYLVTIILLAVFIVSVLLSLQESTTSDERAHIPAAYSYVKYLDMHINPEHPPLLKDLAGLPLLFMDLRFPIENTLWTEGLKEPLGDRFIYNEQWDLGTMFIFSNDADAVMFWSRFPIILIALLLGFFIFQWTKELAGTVAGLFALVLYAFDPNVLGHNHYVTTDLGIAAFIFISFYFFIKFLKKPAWKNVLLAGIFLGLAQLTKFSAVLLFPYFGLILVVYALAKKNPAFIKLSVLKFKWNDFWNFIGKYILVVIICFGIIWISYNFNTFNMPENRIAEVSEAYIGNGEAGAITKNIINKISSIPLMGPIADYLWGVAMVLVRVAGGNTYYFMGEIYKEAKALYFPLVFSIKETLPFLFLLLTTSLFTLFQISKNLYEQKNGLIKKVWKIITNYLRTGLIQYSMFGFVVLYSYLSITGNLTIGFRHLFPIMPFLYVLIAKKVFDFSKNIHSKLSRVTFNISLSIIVIWIILIPIIHFPSYLSYFNELVGGPKNGYHYVTDSNTDWGQDLKRLASFLNNHPEIGKIRVDYFGGASPEYYLRDKFVQWHSYWDPEPGWYAVSAGYMQESIYKKKPLGEKSYLWTLNYEPIRIGDSIFVYYITPEEATAVSQQQL